MADLPRQGESLPDLELTTESGEHIGTGELTGQKTVLYFYPKDDTPGCTKEVCAFRDRMADYEGAGIRVYGVSLDSPESHRQFREKHNLNFPLLTDESGRASERWECWATGATPTASPSCSAQTGRLRRSTRRSLPRRTPTIFSGTLRRFKEYEDLPGRVFVHTPAGACSPGLDLAAPDERPTVPIGELRRLPQPPSATTRQPRFPLSTHSHSSMGRGMRSSTGRIEN